MTRINILSLPDVALESILSYLSYDEVATNRLVCKQFNTICGGILTKGFVQLEKKHAHIYKLVKALLPRRPSERRSNMLVSRYCGILQGMETRIRMLNVTYMRYIDQRLICFLPGKVLDEIRRLLSLIENRFDPPHNNNQLLEELRDLSSMAMEHFDEHILPHLEKREEVIQQYETIPVVSKPVEEDKTHEELKRIHKRNRIIKSKLTYLITKTRRICGKYHRQNIRMKKQSTIIKEQSAKLKVQSTRLQNHEMTIEELKKKIEELQGNFLEMKSKWELDMIQTTIIPPVPTSLNKVSTDNIEGDQTLLSKNLRKSKQADNFRQKYSVMRRIGNRNATESRIMSKPQISKEITRKKCVNIVDIDKWRYRCPSSRLSYSIWHRNYPKNKPTKSDLSDKNHIISGPHQSNSQLLKNSRDTTDFVYKSIIKQRSSRVFPLTCFDFERKRKSNAVCSEIPSKISKNNSSNTLNALDLIHKYLPGPPESQINSVCSSSIATYMGPDPPAKRKRD